MDKYKVIEEAKKIFDIEICALEKVKNTLDESFSDIIELIVNCSGKVIVTGMGKPGHIGSKIAATMASLGTSAFFLHPAEALHGDLGVVQEKDVVIAISYSGESEEIIRMLPNIRIIGAKIVAITGNGESTLSEYSDYKFVFPKFNEACGMNLAPTSSTTSTLVLGDSIAICASKQLGFNKENFALYHPAGSLGKKLLVKVSDIMHSDEKNSYVYPEATLNEAIIEMSSKSLGVVNIVTEKMDFLGIYTDGDLRRSLSKEINVYLTKIKEIMHKKPIYVDKKLLAVDALKIMMDKNISVMPVLEDGLLVGTIRVNDILRAGVVI